MVSQNVSNKCKSNKIKTMTTNPTVSIYFDLFLEMVCYCQDLWPRIDLDHLRIIILISLIHSNE